MKLPEGGKPYEWVRIQLLAQADNFAQSRFDKFNERVVFLDGVRWLLNESDKRDLLGVLAELLDGDNGSK